MTDLASPSPLAGSLINVWQSNLFILAELVRGGVAAAVSYSYATYNIGCY